MAQEWLERPRNPDITGFMAKKDITVVCPCCETELIVDVLTQKVLRHRAKHATPESTWGEASPRVAELSPAAAPLWTSATRGEGIRELWRELDAQLTGE